MSAEARQLEVKDLVVSATATGAELVAGASFTLQRSEVLGVVGESGSGKTSLALALLGFARPGTRISGGSVMIGGADILALDDHSLRLWRGRAVGFVPQNPAGALSPGMRVGRQIEEIIELRVPAAADRAKALQAAWTRAQLPFEAALLRRYPHQLSGGQNQRVAIALALALDPPVLVMDEPTTGLDVITQARLIEVIRALPEKQGCSIVYVSHDLGVVRSLADRVAVMYAGDIVEEASAEALFRRPAHPYTRGLLEAIPRLTGAPGALRGIAGQAAAAGRRPAGCGFAPRCGHADERCHTMRPPSVDAGSGGHLVRCFKWAEVVGEAPRLVTANDRSKGESWTGAAILGVRDLAAGYPGRRTLFGRRAGATVVKGISFDIERGSCLAIVGESGSGKTTLGRCIAGLHEPSGGEMRFDETVLPLAPALRQASVRKRIQIVFQDPDSSLNPSMTIARILSRPLRQFFNLDRDAERERIQSLLRRVGLAPALAASRPAELSGGQKQRAAIARALAAEPDLLVCDEVTSALDAAVQASILELLGDIRKSTGMAMLFISHGLGVVRAISDRVIIMRDGALVEAADTATIFAAPRDAYTQSLLEAAPDLRPDDYPAGPAAGVQLQGASA